MTTRTDRMRALPAAVSRIRHVVTAVILSAGVVAAGLAGTTRPAAAQGIPLIRDSEIEALLADYSRPIFRAAGLGDGRIAIQIVRSDVFNAFVLDGRHVYIHTGALMQSDTPNQVIGVIAHESGHIAGGHMAALRSRIERDQTKLLLLRILGIGVAVAGGGGAAAVAGDELVMRSLLAERRSQEGAADQAGITYLNRIRQSGLGMLQTFERFQQQEYVSDTYKDPFVRSHPVATDRLANLREIVQRSPYYNVKDPPELQRRHDLMRAKLSGYLEPPSTVLNRYPESDRSVPARYARAVAKFFKGGPGGLEAALAEIDGLIKEQPKYPYFWELKGDLLMRAGRPAEAAGPLRQALKLAPGTSLIAVQLATALVQTRDARVLSEAEGLLRRAVVVDEDSRAHRTLADIAYRRGNRAEADASTAQALLLEGNPKQAQIFAKRAQVGLRKGSPLWVKMDDIVRAKIEAEE